MSDSAPSPARAWLGFAVAIVAVFALGLLTASVMERRVEAQIRTPLVQINAYESDNGKWAVNWPREHASWKKTLESTSETKHGGAKPRDLLAETPANVILFAGYAFSVDYNQARGHMHAVEDVEKTGRDISTKPATCWTCKSPDVPRLMAEMGPAAFYASKAKDLHTEIQHPIGCLDCHDPDTMALRISRPALVEAWASQGKDIRQASHQEMRSLVCAQCHVEYYFKKEPKNYLTFPWSEGMKIEDMEKYYDANGHVDWVHPISKTPIVKMQHPDYEVYSQGIHAYRNVSCADCHMPYKTEGGAKFTDHHIQSPLNNIQNSCAVCHRWGEAEIRGRVTAIQDKVAEGRHRAELALAQVHFDALACIQAGATDEELKPVRDLIRRSQMRWDYVAANNGMGFHAPQECQRILAAALDQAQQARVLALRLLATRGVTAPVAYPDYSSKEKAQALIQDIAAGKAPRLIP